MNITVSEALSLRASLLVQLQELRNERITVSKSQYLENDELEISTRTLSIVEEEIFTIQRDYLELNEKIAIANLNNLIPALDFGFDAVNIYTAIELSKILRNELSTLKRMATEKKTSYEPLLNAYSREAKKLKTITNYDPNEYRKRGIDLERKVNRLSSEIEKANLTFTIQFDRAEKYM